MNKKKKKECCLGAGSQWLTLIILAIWEAEIRRIMVRGQLRRIG
jgi:hypothetical protein